DDTANEDADSRVEPVPACHADGEADNDNSDRNGGVARHVEKRTANVEVALAPGHKEQRRNGVDDHASSGNPHDNAARNRLRAEESLDGFPSNAADYD